MRHAFAIFVVAFVASSPLHAFVCSRAGNNGPSLIWETRRIDFSISEAPSDTFSIDEILSASRFGFDQWSVPPCSDFEFTFSNEASTPDDRAGFNWRAGTGNAPNKNLIVFRSDGGEEADRWLHSSSFVALTTVTFEAATGQILDADIEMNETLTPFIDCVAPCTGGHDVRNTLTHELGHALGLDHSADAAATMQASTSIGDIEKRDLANDDIDGLCSLYPSGQESPECYGIERKAPDLKIVRACSSQNGGHKGLPAGAFLALLFGMCVLMRPRISR